MKGSTRRRPKAAICWGVSIGSENEGSMMPYKGVNSTSPRIGHVLGRYFESGEPGLGAAP